MDLLASISTLASELVAIDSRSHLSNLDAIERCLVELREFDVERIDYLDVAGTPKRVAVARRGVGPCLALCGHVDTVPDLHWTDDPWSGRVEGGILHGLGATDMKGPLSSLIATTKVIPKGIPIAILLTTDEETNQAGARTMVARSKLVYDHQLRAIVIAEPTGLCPVRSHRGSITFTARSLGIQAHSATGLGRNANWALVDFLSRVNGLRERLKDDIHLHDPDFVPTISDFNVIIETVPTAMNITVGEATAKMSFRYTSHNNPDYIVEQIQTAAIESDVSLHVQWDVQPFELPLTHPLVSLAEHITGRRARTQPYGTDASQLQAIAPCIVLGPGDISLAHQPQEWVRIAELAEAVPVFAKLAEHCAKDFA